MGQVNGQDARDIAVYRAWVDGARQDDLAEQYGVTQPAISQAIARVQETLPPVDKEREISRTLDLADDLMSAYVDKARAGNTAASREVRGYLMLKARWLGVDRREVQVERTGMVQVQHEPGPTVEELLERWRAEGRLRVRGELTRMDGGG